MSFFYTFVTSYRRFIIGHQKSQAYDDVWCIFTLFGIFEEHFILIVHLVFWWRSFKGSHEMLHQKASKLSVEWLGARNPHTLIYLVGSKAVWGPAIWIPQLVFCLIGSCNNPCIVAPACNKSWVYDSLGLWLHWLGLQGTWIIAEVITNQWWSWDNSQLGNTLPKTNVAPENWWLEDYVPFERTYFQVRTVSFRGVGIYANYKLPASPKWFKASLGIPILCPNSLREWGASECRMQGS